MTSIRLNISHAMGVFSRYQSNLGKTHWQASKRITRYLKGIKGMNYALA